MFDKLRSTLARWMMGRYGQDRLNRDLVILALVLMALAALTRLQPVRWLALAVLLACYWRMFSRELEKRYRENQRYLTLLSSVRQRAGRLKTRLAQRRSYHFYRCPRCRQALRVPRGRGKIEITCPKCQAQFIKNS